MGTSTLGQALEVICLSECKARCGGQGEVKEGGMKAHLSQQLDLTKEVHENIHGLHFKPRSRGIALILKMNGLEVGSRPAHRH